MKVTNIWAGKELVIPQTENEDKSMTKIEWETFFPKGHPVPGHIEMGVSCNTAEKPGATDKAMFELIERASCKVDDYIKNHLSEHKIRFPFSSKRKRMSTICENVEGVGKRLHIKGASEIVKNCCSHYLDADGNRQQLTDDVNGNMDNVIHNFASQALRTICLAYKDVTDGMNGPKHDEPADAEIKDIEKKDLTLICILGIKDIVRIEVPDAVLQI